MAHEDADDPSMDVSEFFPAGASVRQGLCSIEEYCGIYSHRRERLLRYRPVQAGSDYKFSVYTTWEVSIEAIKRMSGETSDNAIELVRIFCFLHYDGISMCERLISVMTFHGIRSIQKPCPMLQPQGQGIP
jgi:hypothetical protein